MSSSKVRKFLAQQFELERINIEDISNYLYSISENQLDDCEIYAVRLKDHIQVGSQKYLAVPNDERDPFYIGELGE